MQIIRFRMKSRYVSFFISDIPLFFDHGFSNISFFSNDFSLVNISSKRFQVLSGITQSFQGRGW